MITDYRLVTGLVTVNGNRKRKHEFLHRATTSAPPGLGGVSWDSLMGIVQAIALCGRASRLDSLIDSLAFGTTCSAKIRT